MSNKRLVYVAGLSQDSDIGSFIRQDISNIKAILENYENEGQIILRTDEYATKRSIISRFMDNKVLPWLFYYSGHSDDNYIALSDAQIPADNFVNLFDNNRIREALQLVYLGSCNSLSIGKKLIDKNIKLVIVSDEKVQAHLANIVSQFFFNTLFTSNNIREAYETTENLFKLDRETFNVNEAVNFPWHILTSSETNLEKALKTIRLSPEQKHQLVMNVTSIRLDMLNYYLKEDASQGKQTDLIKKEAESIKDKLDTTIHNINEDGKIRTLIEPLINSPTIDLLPSKDRLTRTSSIIKNLDFPKTFVERTVDRISNMRHLSDNIINF
ncbi:hypothetical protein [Seonamhaeicola sp.]|uniref:hypothetical protein n=1 Tax=Seonamhaeicola sp. TaxID=1912245 RepID=UPI0026230E7C|nr:hypothetical protein [Seonamhaeicola sp.]